MPAQLHRNQMLAQAIMAPPGAPPSGVIPMAEGPPDWRRNEMLARMLMGQGMNGPPVRHWAEGLGRLAQVVGAGYMQGQAQEGQQAEDAALEQVLLERGVTLPENVSLGMLPPEARGAMLANALEGKAAEDLKQVFDPATGGMIWVPESQAAGKGSAVPLAIEQQQALERAQAGRSSTTINTGGPQIGTIPAGFQLMTDPATGAYRMEPIPGGPAANEAAAAEAAATAAAGSRQQTADIVTQDIDRAIERINSASVPVTGLGSILTALPGSAAADVSALVDTIKANTGFDKLQAMREASPTGGALGNVTELELQMLQAAVGNLSLSQGQEQLVQNLQRVKQIYGQIVHGTGGGQAAPAQAAPTGQAPAAGAPVQIQSDADYEALAPGTVFIAPDGTTRRKP